MSESKAELDKLDQEARRTSDLIRQQLKRESVQVHVVLWTIDQNRLNGFLEVWADVI